MNEALRTLYQGVVLDHQAHPRNHGPLPGATHEARVENPLCGDRVTVRLRLDGDQVAQAGFEGDGCAISIASASLLTERVRGLRPAEALALGDELRRLLDRGPAHLTADRARLGDLVALEGTRAYPTRVRCATLAWEALAAALAAVRG